MVSFLQSPMPLFDCSGPYLGGPQLADICSEGLVGSFFLGLLNTFLALSPNIGESCDRIDPITTPDRIYDFIVVGAGAAGAVVASRLSEVKDWSVLLVEAGPDEPAGAEVPSNFMVYLGTELDWKYVTTNESYACLNTNGRCSYPRGKNIGGNTLHYGMAYHRGHPKDYEKWVKLGNKNWSWNDVFPYYLKSEDNREIKRVGSKYHATGGLMTVERFPYQPPFAWKILDAANEAGFGVREDLIGDHLTGFTVAQTISKDGVRLSSARAFITPFLHRKNLDVATNAIVTKVLTRNKRATGVQLLMNGKKYTIQAKREVILSGGTINTPQLLLLSGIGPKEQLRSKNIPVVVDLPGVGENLHNHHSFGLDFTLSERSEMELNIDNAEQYLFNQTGPLSSTGLAQVTGVLASKLTTPDDPDIQIFFAGYQATCKIEEGLSDKSGNRTVRFTSVNLHPKSRGRITLNTTNPLDKPIIWSNDMGTEHDRAVVVEGIHAIMALAKTPTMKKLGLRLKPDVVPQCKQHEFATDDYWDCAVRWNTRPENHQTGTSKMGPASDPMAVVNERLEVHGVKGLRVVDSAAIPIVVSGNPCASVIMLAERASDFIKQAWKIPTK